MSLESDEVPTEGRENNRTQGSRPNKKKKKKKKRKKTNHDNAESESKRQKLEHGSDVDTHEDSKKLSVDQKPNAMAHTKKKNKKKKRKDRRVKSPTANEEATTDVEPQDQQDDSEETTFPYPTDEDDHCESPLIAYAHIQPLLQILQSNGTKKGSSKDLKIYDPYYCNGAVIENLTSIGYPSVYNKKEDCYQTWASDSSYPEYDVFLTNPPYSGDHIEKLVKHLTSLKVGTRPWFLLMPEWVHKKDYFIAEMKRKQIQPFYLVPKKRYVYLPPKNYRAAKKSDVHKKSSPFNSMWYIWGGTREQNDQLIQAYYDRCRFPVVEDSAAKMALLADACDLARSKNALRDLRRKVKKK